MREALEKDTAMNEPLDSRKLLDRVRYLEENRRFIQNALEMALSLGDFQESIDKRHDPDVVLREAESRIRTLMPFEGRAFYFTDAENDFVLSVCEPADLKAVVEQEVNFMIDEGFFAWALRERRGVVLSSRDRSRRFLLHVVATYSRIRGMFVGLLPRKRETVPDSSLTLLSIVLQNTANALESIVYINQLKENQLLRRTLDEIRGQDQLVGQSPAFLQVLKMGRAYARTEYPILITGESGTGKDAVANQIHRWSRRKDRPLLVQNCSAIPDTLLESELFGYRKGAFTGAVRDKEGLFQAADGGTVFLDEIGDMPLNLQARILRFIQNGEIKPLGDTGVRKVDVRIVCATNKNMQEAINNGNFRQDLFYRISVLPLHLPPLRERREDIPLLLTRFVKREALKMGLEIKTFEDDAMERLRDFPWEGNIRELENFARYMLVTVEGRVIAASDLPRRPVQQPGAGQPREAPPPDRVEPSAVPSLFDAYPSWEEVEKAYVLHLLEKNMGNVTLAAREAAVNRSTFASRMRRLGVQRKAVSALNGGGEREEEEAVRHSLASRRWTD